MSNPADMEAQENKASPCCQVILSVEYKHRLIYQLLLRREFALKLSATVRWNVCLLVKWLFMRNHAAFLYRHASVLMRCVCTDAETKITIRAAEDSYNIWRNKIFPGSALVCVLLSL